MSTRPTSRPSRTWPRTWQHPRKATLRGPGLTLCLVATGWLMVGCAPPDASLASGEPAAPLSSQIEYRFVGDRGETDAEGWTLLWIASMEGDLAGEARWYFLQPNPIPDVAVQGASLAYYEARWEVRVSDQVVLAGRSAGKTVTPEGEDGIWDGHGVVTSAAGSYQDYVGRHTYETGPVVFSDEGPWGRGLFTVH